MKSSRIITLFQDPPPSTRGPSSVVVSVLLHSLVVGVGSLALRHMPRIDDRLIAERYTVRLMQLRWTPPQKPRSGGSEVAYPTPQAVARAVQPGGNPASPSAPQELEALVPASQTLVQPDVHILLPNQTAIPSVLLWSAESSPIKKIVPPPPLDAAIVKVRPSLDRPNRELNMADLRISPTAFVTETPALPTSTTSPLVVRGPAPAKQVPETASRPAGPPTPATVLSISDLQVQEGTIALPQANQIATSSSSGALGTARSQTSSPVGNGTSPAGNGNPASKQNGIGAGLGAGDQGDKAIAAGGPGAQTGAATGPNQGSDAGSGLGSEPSVTRIALPKDGKFDVVVVGSSLAEKYPETVGLWGGRLAYTVYLHVGLGKSWILQYSMPRAAEAAAAGNVTRPEAPWPYDIVRPNLAPGDLNADAVMVHGFVNVAGRFEKLAIVFPPEFTQTKFMLDALEQWHFRPAMQNGQIASVEVLLIIPEQAE